MTLQSPRPTRDDIRGFLLGSLPPDSSERLVAWVEEHPEATDVLGEIRATDPLTEALATVALNEKTTPHTIERIVRSVGEKLHFTASFAPQLPLIPRIQGFTIEGELGRGGMGVVYKAVDDKTGQVVAIKMPICQDVSTRKRFQREGEAARAINSNFAVKILGVGETEEKPYLVMEYLTGSTLKRWQQTRGEPITAKDLIWIARDALTGLASIHAAKIIHRDIKPENLWVQDGLIKVMDFGLARKSDGGDDLTKTGVVLGSLEYMSPEQGAGKPLDVRTDLFSLGVVLYKIAEPKAPFKMGYYHSDPPGNPPPLDKLPPVLSHFITKLLSNDPDKRPENAGLALEELRLIEQQLNSEASTGTMPRNSRNRNHQWIAAGLIPLLALVLGGVIIIIKFKDGTKVQVESNGPVVVEASNTDTGEKIVVDTGSTGKPQPPGPTDKDKVVTGPSDPTKIVIGSQVKVRPKQSEGAKVVSYENETLNQFAKYLDPGTIGEVKQISDNRYRIRIMNGPSKDDVVWVSDIYVELLNVR